jgi:hypothetical protein
MTVDAPAETELPGDSLRSAATREELIIKEARQHHRRRVLTTVGVVVLVAAGILIDVLIARGHGTSSPRSSTVSAVRPDRLPNGTSVCRTGQIRVSSLGGGAGAGNVDQVFGFVNIGRAACSLTGYPRIVALDGEGRQVAVAEHQLTGIGGIKTGDTSPPVVTLKPGETASAIVSGTDIPIGNATVCPAGYPAFLVTPPDMTQPVNVSAVDGSGSGPFPGCSTVIRVNPIVPGASGQFPVGPSAVPSGMSPGGPPVTSPAGASSEATTP